MALGLDNLKHIVVLMMGSRSFDHMLGFLKEQVPEIDGLTGHEANPDTTGQPQRVQPTAAVEGKLTPVPDRSWEGVNVQVFGNPQGFDDGSPKMQGFIKSYYTRVGDVNRSRYIMDCFSPSDLPVLTYLAHQYAVCDRWFSSFPGPTLPNLLFTHFGTSFGNIGNITNADPSSESIYERILKAGGSANIYHFDKQSTSFSLPLLRRNMPRMGTYSDFKYDCSAGTLPHYSFVEPNFSYHGSEDGYFLPTDQHPDHNVIAGENFIADVYNNVRKGPRWNNTLLIIVYDQHGGIYDHVTPPEIEPDGLVDPASCFQFDRLGVRVPAILVSPWIQPGTVLHTQYEHASIPATLANLFVADRTRRNLTLREQRANLFAPDPNLLTLERARTDSFYFQAVQPDRTIEPPAVPRQANAPQARKILIPAHTLGTNSAARPISFLLHDHIRELVRLEQTLPPDQRTNIDFNSLRTEQQANEYIGRVVPLLRQRGKESREYSKPAAQELIERFKATAPGNADANAFALICQDSMKYLFGADLGQLRSESSIEDGFQYMDLVARLSPRLTSGFWISLAQDFRCRYVVFEFKNYTEPISQNQIYTTEKYLYPNALRPVAIVIARNGADDGAKRAAKGALRDTGKVLLVLSLNEIYDLLLAKDAGREPNDLMADHLDNLLTALAP